ncbi:MAG: hypothetical protein LBL56_07840 [Treponema sp.]|jgi:hypothetical protein|nr:hypothetical protein [Treponema sp.]
MGNTGENPAGGRGKFPKALLSALPVLTVLLFLSCASGSGRGSWNSYPEAPAYWDYRSGEIRVTVDHVREEAVASQIRVMADIILAGGGEGKRAADTPARINTHAQIDIRVEQRSFLHDVELLNAIYIDCLISDEEGRVLGREYEYRVGKGSILSSREQERLFQNILGRILKSRRDRYREIRSHYREIAKAGEDHE